MEFDKNSPIYIQIMDKIKEDLITGLIRPGDKMPSVRDYSAQLRVNPTTIQRVYRELEGEGLTYTERGMGSYVSQSPDLIEKLKKERALRLTTTYVEKMKTIGFDEDDLLELIKNIWREQS